VRRVDLNADVGSGYGRWTLGDESAVLPYVTSANVSCGFHAGDPQLMRRTLQALRAGVQGGAHVGLPDLLGYGVLIAAPGAAASWPASATPSPWTGCGPWSS